MRRLDAVNNVNSLSSAKASSAAKGRRISAQADFATLLAQRSAGAGFQRSLAASASNRSSSLGASPAGAVGGNAQPTVVARQQVASSSIAVSPEVAQQMAQLLDPVNQFNEKVRLSRYGVESLEIVAWKEHNKIENSGGDWRSSVEEHRKGLNIFYERVVSSGRATPEMTEKYNEAMTNLDNHEKRILSGQIRDFSYAIDRNGRPILDYESHRNGLRNSPWRR